MIVRMNTSIAAARPGPVYNRGMFANPPDSEVAARLRQIRTIAVVGLSPNPSRPSHGVAKALMKAGFRVVPVRPGTDEVLGETAYPDLESVPGKIDLVDVFRAPEHVPAIVDDVLRLGLPAVWLQDGVVDEDAAQRARDAGVFVVMDRCIARDGLPLLERDG